MSGKQLFSLKKKGASSDRNIGTLVLLRKCKLFEINFYGHRGTDIKGKSYH